MTAREPAWWYAAAPSWQARVLSPLASVYGAISARRMSRPLDYHAKYPVICAGNFTAGGTGKTPLALTLAALVRDLGYNPVFLSRGYGGTLKGPVLIDAAGRSARDIGDEPVLLSRQGPVVISRDRVLGAKLIEEQFAANTVIIMDDGFQNPALAKNFSIVLVDAGRGIGNAMCIPAGPLRAPIAVQTLFPHAVAVSGSTNSDLAGAAQAVRTYFSGPVLRARVEAAGDTGWLSGRRILAYAGIANPGRFFALAQSLGAEIVRQDIFPDHHRFSANEAANLIAEADALRATLVTTEKDFCRLDPQDPAHARLRSQSKVLAVAMHFEEADRAVLRDMIAKALAIHSVDCRSTSL